LKLLNKGARMPNPKSTLEEIHYSVYPGDKKIILDLKKQEKPILCKLRLSHDWSKNHNGIRYCKKCGRVDFYFGITGIIRKMKEKNKA